MLPDVDAVGYWLGVPKDALLGHRGLTHSLSFALLGGLATALVLARGKGSAFSPLAALYLVLAMASHGLLDACTNGGPGIAFFSPFSNARYFLPFRPITVSPIGFQGALGERGLRILLSEIRWVLMPSLLLAGSGVLARSWWARRRNRPAH